MNARQKAKQYRKMYEGLLNSQPKVTILPTHTQEFCTSRLLAPIEYKYLDKESFKALLASDLAEVIKDSISYTITEDERGRYYRVEARLRICK